MKKIYTFLTALVLSVCAFAATEQAWYNDVTSITANGQYYIYSVNGKAFMQAGQAQVKAITTSNYTNVSTFKFKISKANEGYVTNGSYYLKSYMEIGGTGSNSGPICTTQSDNGTKIIWTSMNSGEYWNIHGSYNAWFADRYAALKYEDNAYEGFIEGIGVSYSKTKDTQTGTKFRWYLVSQAQLDRHFAIYFFDAYKETVNIAQYENQVPAAYYSALQTAYNKTFSVTNTAHSADVVNAAKAELEALYNGAPAIQEAYATVTGLVNALEAVEDKGEDYAQITSDIADARTAIEAATTVDALNAAVAGLKAVDPITFNQTTFEALRYVNEAATSAAGRTITFTTADNAIINAEGKAIYAGTTTLTATAEATDAYYKFVRSAQVTVTAWDTYGDYEETTCDKNVAFFGKEYTETTTENVTVGTNYIGGDSIVRVAITINHATEGTDTKTIVYGAEESWNGIDLSGYAVGKHTVPFMTTNVAGCDSTVTLTLTVNKQETLKEEVPLNVCAGDSVEYRGVWYAAQGEYDIPAEGATRDTVYNVHVTVNPTYEIPMSKNAIVGEEVYWGGHVCDTRATGVYQYVDSFLTVAGCDSVHVLTLTVTKADVVKEDVPLVFCAGDSAEFRGEWYKEAGEYPVYAEGEVADTVYNVTVTVNQPTFDTDELTIQYSEAAVWNGIDLSGYMVGEHEIPFTTTNAAGCDSTITLTLKVEKMDFFETTQELELCEGDTVEYRGVAYFEAGEYPVYAEGEVRDTTITVKVIVHEVPVVVPGLIEVTVGEIVTLPEGEWYLDDVLVSNEYQTVIEDTVGLEFIRYAKTEFGCEYVDKIVVVVTPDYEAIDDVYVGEKAVKFFREGQLYIRRGEEIYTVVGERVK